MQWEIITLSKLSQSQKDKYHVSSHLWVPDFMWIHKSYMYMTQKEKQSCLGKWALIGKGVPKEVSDRQKNPLKFLVRESKRLPKQCRLLLLPLVASQRLTVRP